MIWAVFCRPRDSGIYVPFPPTPGALCSPVPSVVRYRGPGMATSQRPLAQRSMVHSGPRLPLALSPEPAQCLPLLTKSPPPRLDQFLVCSQPGLLWVGGQARAPQVTKTGITDPQYVDRVPCLSCEGASCSQLFKKGSLLTQVGAATGRPSLKVGCGGLCMWS